MIRIQVMQVIDFLQKGALSFLAEIFVGIIGSIKKNDVSIRENDCD